MTTTTLAATRVPLVTRPLMLLFVSDFGATVSFYLLLSVVPLYVTELGVGTAGAGVANGALLLGGVAAELATPRLAVRYGYRFLFAVGLLLLGLPTLAMCSNVAVIVTACAARGLGFGVTAVVGAALVAEVVPAERRGEGLGLYGIVAGVPAVIALPAGVWLADAYGYRVVFALAALSALVGLAATRGLPGRVSVPSANSHGRSSRHGMRHAVVFAMSAMAAGAVVTFLPLATAEIAAVALLTQSLAATVSRWWAGRVGDRHGSARLLVPSVLVTASGVAVVALVGSPFAVLAGMTLFGAGFGVLQNASLAVMFERAPASAYGSVSALWNLAYDSGMGLGGVGFGVLAATTGYSWAFVVTAALIAITIRLCR